MVDFPRWDLFALNALAFSLFLILIPVNRQNVKTSAGPYLSFIVALFAEMYGFPLSVFVLTSILGSNEFSLRMEGIFQLTYRLGFAIMIIGMALVFFGWRRIYGETAIATTGIYRIVRHPQYLGLILLTLGLLVQWPTLPTMPMWSILTVLYYRLAKREEESLEQRFGEPYRQYRRKVPMFLPRPRIPSRD